MNGLHSRRALLAGVGATLATAATALPVVDALAQTDTCAVAVDTLPLDPATRYELALAEFKAAAEALYPDIYEWTNSQGDTGVFAFGFRPRKPVEYTGFGVYEVRRGKAQPIIALKASTSGKGYFWQHYWLAKNRLEGEPRFIAARHLTIVQKIKPLA